MPLPKSDIEQLNIPPNLPLILKQYCKSAIRTQPYDLLKWSHAYFQALARGEEPPVKQRLEYTSRNQDRASTTSAHGLTLGFLKVLYRQLGGDYNRVVSLDLIYEKWDNLCLDHRDSSLIRQIGRFKKSCPVKKYLAIAVGLISRNITETMLMVCELFTNEPEGGSDMIPVGLFLELYGYLGGLRCDGSEKDPSEDNFLCSRSTPTLTNLSITRQSTSDQPSVIRTEPLLQTTPIASSQHQKASLSSRQRSVNGGASLGDHQSRRGDTIFPKIETKGSGKGSLEELKPATSSNRSSKESASHRFVRTESQSLKEAERSNRSNKSLDQETKNDKKTSLGSQDTDADAEVDLELGSLDKDDELLAPEDQDQIERDSLEHSLAGDSFRGGEMGDNQSLDNKTLHSGPSAKASREPSDARLSEGSGKGILSKESSFDFTGSMINSPVNSDKFSTESTTMRSQKSIKVSHIYDSPRCLPVVPGIGRKLLTQEIACVAIWLNDCAKRQDGMVGPRNIRHVNCPSLEGIICTSSKKVEEDSEADDDDDCKCDHE